MEQDYNREKENKVEVKSLFCYNKKEKSHEQPDVPFERSDFFV